MSDVEFEVAPGEPTATDTPEPGQEQVPAPAAETAPQGAPESLTGSKIGAVLDTLAAGEIPTDSDLQAARDELAARLGEEGPIADLVAAHERLRQV